MHLSRQPYQHLPMRTMRSQVPASPPTLPRIQKKFGGRGNLLLDLPIAGRLTLGFLTAALLAALVTGSIGFQRSQSLSKQSEFYQNLLRTNTTLTTGANFLQLMDTETHTTLNVAAQPQPSQETLQTDQKAVHDLAARYDSTLTGYIAHDLLVRHNDQVALLAEAYHDDQVNKQITLASSALRTWQVYQAAQAQIITDISSGDIAGALHLEQAQGEPTHADALSALRSLIQFNGRLATSIQDVANVEEQNQIIMTVAGSIVTFLAIALVGWFISGTLVRRLKLLRRVTQDVENGQLNARVTVVGRDEIADVSASVNAMLEAIVGLFEETSRQRDALSNAAAHLFSDMRVVSSGDLRVNAPVSNDPIGMLANAFNFTVGRFRRFVLRTQTTAEQLDVISRQGLKRSESFMYTLSKFSNAELATPETPRSAEAGPLRSTSEPQMARRAASGPLKQQAVPITTTTREPTKDQSQEMMRLGTDFATEVNMLSRKLAAVVHEMRVDTVSFQLDSASGRDLPTGMPGNLVDQSNNYGMPTQSGPNTQPLSPRYKNRLNHFDN